MSFCLSEVKVYGVVCCGEDCKEVGPFKPVKKAAENAARKAGWKKSKPHAWYCPNHTDFAAADKAEGERNK